jgi:undecaprenyl-diphosphatase
MELLTVIILGIVEGVTEFIPVSSTGHLILASALLGYDPERWKVFNVVIQLGAILAVLVLYWRTFWVVGIGLLRLDPVSIRFVRNLLIAFLPSAVIGLLLLDHIEAMLGSAQIVAWALIAGGLAIIAIERFAKKADIVGVAEIPLGRVIAIGFIQCLSMIPGVSRSGATILGALSLGVERRTAAEFSFFLAVPTMLGASTLELVKYSDEIAQGIGASFAEIAVGFVISFVVAVIVVRAFVHFVSRHGFGPFAWYRIIAGAAALVWLAAR